MKKTILKTLFAILFFVVNQNVEAQTADLATKLWLRSSPTSGGPNLTVTTAASTYKVYIRTEARETTGKYGSFSVSYQRRQIAPDPSSWTGFTPTHVSSSSTFGSTYSTTRYVYQSTGTKYQYRVRVTFNPTAAGIPNRTEYTPIRTADIKWPPKACFYMYSVQSTQTENSKFSPQTVRNICDSKTVAINPMCSVSENAYHVRIAEFNLSSWTFGTDYYNGWTTHPAGTTSFINLETLAASNGKTFLPGKLYIVILSVGSTWNSAAPQFFRVVPNCRVAIEDDNSEVQDIKPLEPTFIANSGDNNLSNSIKLYPNPVEDYFKISMSDSDLAKGALISVVNSKGMEVYKGTIEANDFKVNTSEWRTGLYFCKIQIGDRIETKKIIKK